MAACLVVFAWSLRDISKASGHSPITAYLVIAGAICVSGVGVFAFPSPLHNVFGQSELIGYQAHLAFALTWRRDPRARTWVRCSCVMGALVWFAIALNLATLDRHGPIWAAIKPVYGLVQRFLFATWLGWVAILGWMTARDVDGARRS